MRESVETIVCPNCGHEATGNFCAHCGQPTHLHKDSFLGMMTHFIGHYFHYDSKFLQTMKALWFSPGKLTLAYLREERMRYIPPISLYIFLSAVYFLAASFLSHDAIFDDAIKTDAPAANTSHSRQLAKTSNGRYTFSLNVNPDQRQNIQFTGQQLEEIKEKARHHGPKIFFFMIPLMGLVLQLLFVRRKELYYVNHIIFALHFHSLWFSLKLIDVLYPFLFAAAFINSLTSVLSVIYFITAMHNVYNISWKKATGYSFIIAMAYALFFAVVLFAFLFFFARGGT